jgi:hypothetical protein
MKTSDALGILWPDPDGGKAEVSGISFYGFFSDDRIPVAAASVAGVWAEHGFETHSYEWLWEIWPVFGLDVRFGILPPDADWMELVELTLRNLAAHGAFVAWCGGELCFTTPVVFENGAYVYAAFFEGAGFFCNAGLSDEWQGLTETQSAVLHRALVDALSDRWHRELQLREEWAQENQLDFDDLT